MPDAPMPMSMVTSISSPMPSPIVSPAPSPIPVIETFDLPSSPLLSSMPTTSLTTSTPTFSPIKLTDDKPYGCLKGGKNQHFDYIIKQSNMHIIRIVMTMAIYTQNANKVKWYKKQT